MTANTLTGSFYYWEANEDQANDEQTGQYNQCWRQEFY